MRIEIERHGYYFQMLCYKQNEQVVYIDGYASDYFIHLMNGGVPEQHQRKGLMSRAVRHLQEMYPEAELSFHNLTEAGKAFVSAAFPEAIVRPRFKEGTQKMLINEYLNKING